MSDYLCARGTVINSTPNNSSGAYAVEGLESMKGDYPLLIDSVNFNKNDILLPVACLGNFKVLYSFGQGFGSVQIVGTILLGPNADGSKFGSLIDWFEQHRSSKSGTPVNVSVLSAGAVKVYLSGLSISDADPNFNTQRFALTGVLVE